MAPINRRGLLLGAAAGAAAIAGAAWKLWPEEGLFNPCHAVLPSDLLRHDIVRSAWAGIEPERFWDCHVHLLNGSDYPLPGIMPLFSVDGLIAQGFLDARAGPVLKAIRQHNPLLFDFVLKRELRSAGKQLAIAVFHTRDFFSHTTSERVTSEGP